MTELEKLKINANQAGADLVSVKHAIQDNGVEVPDGTRTSKYGELIGDVYSAGHDSGYEEGNEAGYNSGYSAGQSSMVDQSKLIPKTVSGSYISVDDVSEIPHSVGCKVESVNLFDKDNFIAVGGYFDAKGTYVATLTSSYKTACIPCSPNTDYVITKTKGSRLSLGDSDKIPEVGGMINPHPGATSTQHIFKTAENAKYICIYYYNAHVDTDVTAEEIEATIMLNKGTTALPHTPYVKPAEVKVTRCGANLCKPTFTGKLFVDSASGSSIYESISVYSQIVPCSPNTTYTVTGEMSAMNSGYMRIGFTKDYPAVGVTTVSTRTSVSSLSVLTFTTPDECNYILLMTGGSSVNEYPDLQINVGSTALPYEPYNEQTLTPSADGTVEGMTSVSPYMNIFSDTEGVNIEATYNKSYGMQTEYDRFWDAFQENGKRINYYQAFGFGDGAAHSPWNNQNFKPKYPIKPSYVNNMFTNFGYRGDVTEAAEIDFSNAWAVYNIFVNCPWITRVGVINCTGMQEGGGALINSCAALETVDKFVFRDDGLQKMSGLSFTSCTSLKNIVFEGKANFDINFKDSPLSKASITSAINTLYEGSTGKTLTLKLSAVNTAFETSAGAGDGSTSAEFAALVATKTNWTITMI